jgi:GT2 family glycosyltransferase
MNVVAYTSSLNGKDSLARCVAALLEQTYLVREVIVVDNRSTDGTQRERFPDRVQLICHLRNLGTSGAAATAFEYALTQGYDWIWVLDQDSVPHQDALERLVRLYETLPPSLGNRVGVLSSVVLLGENTDLLLAHHITPGGGRLIPIDLARAYQEVDTTIWSGSMYRLEAVRRVGLPRFGLDGYWQDFALDMGDIEFGYRIKQAGYSVLVSPSSLIDHCLGDLTVSQVLGRRIHTSQHRAFRRYLAFRNMVYFWLYLNRERRLLPTTLFLGSRLCRTICAIVLIENQRGAKILACLRGVWDGLRGKLSGRFRECGS